MIAYHEVDERLAWGPAIRGVTYNGTAGLLARRVAGLPAGVEPAAVCEIASFEEITQALEHHRSSNGAWPAVVAAANGDIWLLSSSETTDDESGGSQAPARGAVVRGRVALVTGAAQGFGWELAQGLAREGAVVVVADLNAEGATARAAELDALSGGSGRHTGLAVDVSDEASVAALVGRIVELYGGVDLVVSNAGVVRSGSVSELSADDFAFVTRVNYSGFFFVTKHTSVILAAQDTAWLASKRGANSSDPDTAHYFCDIVEINSKSGLEGSNKNGAYAGSKFGGIGLVQSFALELIEFGTKVNALCPGNFLDGPLWSDPERGLFVQYLEAGKVPGAQSVADVRAAYEARVPVGRGCTGRDVLRALLYAVEQRYETGQAIPITGGQVMLS